MLCCSLRRHLRKLLAVVQIEKTHFFAFTILRCYKIWKKAFTLADRAFEIKQFYKHAGVPIFVEHWGGDNLQYYPNFDLFSTLGGMNLDHDFVRVSKLSEEQNKKRSLSKMEHFFPRNQLETCAQMHTRVKLLKRKQMNTILKLLGGIQSNYWGDISPQ